MTNTTIYEEFWNTFKGVQAYSFYNVEKNIKGKYVIKNTGSTTKVYLHIFGASMRKAVVRGIGFNRSIDAFNKILDEMRKVNTCITETEFLNVITENLKETDSWQQYKLTDILTEKGFVVIQVI